MCTPSLRRSLPSVSGGTTSSGVERVCIVNSDRKISSVITQSTALKFCHDNVKLFAEGAEATTVNDMTLKLGKPLVIHENARPLTAFRIMADNVRRGEGKGRPYGFSCRRGY